ncbi:MAG: xanthine dehydrogenase family protein subunit M [Elusimicrobia bacterium]|nr:xanthine dehydrogenase family protein subunit M [Elusimicrobiota bacterium]
MPIACEFEYYKPKTLPEALALLAKHKGKAQALAGGTDLLVWMKEGLRSPEAVVDVKALKELKGLDLKGGALHVGARTTFAELIESKLVKEKFPLLWECSRTVASVGVRNRATLAGNICSAVPSLDSAPALLTYEAVVLVQGSKGKRDIPISQWFTGPKKTALKDGELVLGVKIPLPKKHGACYAKLGRYRGEDLAQVGVGIMALANDEYRVAFCAVGPTPMRAKRIENALNGNKLSDELICRAQELVPQEIKPISDIRSSKEYRLHMAGVMLERGLKAAAARLAGEGPAYGESVL